MGALDGRIAVVTGAGGGIGREHALLFAREGAHVVVNDLGGAMDGTGGSTGPAQQVVDEIAERGGTAIANTDNVASWEGAQRLVNQAIETYGGLDILVNNAGILRDRVLINMTEDEWDAVINVHLKGHFCPTRHAAAYWRACAKDGNPRDAVLVHTSSTSGLLGNPGQANYAAAKAGIAAFGLICHMELNERYNVRTYTLAPAARTRLTENTPGLGQVVAPPEDEGSFDVWHPANISPLVAWLGTAGCPAPSGSTFFVQGGTVRLMQGWTMTTGIDKHDRWTVAELQEEGKKLFT